jgi:hypothetical protein
MIKILALLLFAAAATAGPVDLWFGSSGRCSYDYPCPNEVAEVLYPNNVHLYSTEWPNGVLLSYSAPHAEWFGDGVPGAYWYLEFQAGGSLVLTDNSLGTPVTILRGRFGEGGRGILDGAPEYYEVDLPVGIDWANPDIFGGGHGSFRGFGSLYALYRGANYGEWFRYNWSLAVRIEPTPEPATWPLIVAACAIGLAGYRARRIAG